MQTIPFKSNPKKVPGKTTPPQVLLTHFMPVVYFYTPRKQKLVFYILVGKRQKTSGMKWVNFDRNDPELHSFKVQLKACSIKSIWIPPTNFPLNFPKFPEHYFSFQFYVDPSTFVSVLCWPFNFMLTLQFYVVHLKLHVC